MGFKMRTLSLPRPRIPLKVFPLRELQVATRNFSVHNIVGEGGFGNVYRGRLLDGSVVAVKRWAEERDYHDKEFEFEAEVQVGDCQASHHKNLSRLIGYCVTSHERILVYPFMVNGSVGSRLWHRAPSQPPLDWAARKRIALGAAKGLAHLHHGSSFTVIHRDVKSDNILIDDQFDALLSDFGLAIFAGPKRNGSSSGLVHSLVEEDVDDDSSEEEEPKSCWNFTGTLKIQPKEHSRTNTNCLEPSTHVNTRVLGTHGYAAPEYMATGMCYVKSDVYGYGVTLLELISGRKAIDPARHANDKEKWLLDWVKRCVAANKSNLVVDPDLRGGFMKKEMKQLLKLALLCTRSTPEERPAMSEVSKIIENMCKLPQLGGGFGQRFTLPELELDTQRFPVNHVFDHANLLQFHESPQPQLPHVFEVGPMMDSPKLDTEDSVSSVFDQAVEAQDSLGSTLQIDPAHRVAFDMIGTQPPHIATQLIHESPTESEPEATLDSDLANCVKLESSPVIEPVQLQSESVLEPVISNNKQQYDFQVNIASGKVVV